MKTEQVQILQELNIDGSSFASMFAEMKKLNKDTSLYHTYIKIDKGRVLLCRDQTRVSPRTFTFGHVILDIMDGEDRKRFQAEPSCVMDLAHSSTRGSSLMVTLTAT